MSLSTGDQLGPYEILAILGQGGMGTVYRAHDPRVQREVAIKVTSEEFAKRFSREARAIASLNHPNVCMLHDVGPNYIVMELVAGETLAERLKGGPIPLNEALPIARQIVEALEAAHENGIVHRDLKPGNIKITPQGHVKVLDFGLAKLRRDPQPDDQGASTVSLSLTESGVVVGTAAYMSPEQASGKVVDHRSDIWAFGVVLHEMVTGARPFRGPSLQETLAAVLTATLDFGAVPAPLRPVVEKCLRRDPRKRWQAIGDVRLALEEGPAAPRAAAASRTGGRPWMAAAAILLVALSALAFVHFRETPPQAEAVRFGVPIPGGSAQEVVFALSPDGRNLAITAVRDGKRNLWLRPLDQLETRLIPGTDGATQPFWSPDGSQIGYWTGGKLWKVSVAGGTPVMLLDDPAAGPGTAAWNQAGDILFVLSGEFRLVNQAGGAVRTVYERGGGGSGGTNPRFLPDGRRFLFVRVNDPGVYVGFLDGADPVRILPDVSAAAFVPDSASSQGYLLFRRRGVLNAQRFDPESLALQGDAFPVTEESVMNTPGYGPTILFSASRNGALAYQSPAAEQLVWVDRRGTVLEPVGPPGEYSNFRLSPDQRRIAMDITRFGDGTSAREIAWLDIERDVLEQLTFHGDADAVPVWAPDSARIAFSSNRLGNFDPYVTSGPNQEQLLVDVPTAGGTPTDWSPDGQFVLWNGGPADLWLVPASGDGPPMRYTSTPFTENNGQFSPDGRWIAYDSDESGRDEVYIQSVPPGRRFAVTGSGGSEPAWRRDGREIYYVARDGMLTAIPVTLGETSVQFGRPEPLFPAPLGPFGRNYEVSLDGQRFLVTQPATPGGAAITVVLNWRALLDR